MRNRTIEIFWNEQIFFSNWIVDAAVPSSSMIQKVKIAYRRMTPLANSISIGYLRATCRHPISPMEMTTKPIWDIEHLCFVVRRTFFVGSVLTQIAITISRKLNAIINLLKHQHPFPNCFVFKSFTIYTYSLLLFLHWKLTIHFTFFDVRDSPGALAWLYYLPSIFNIDSPFSSIDWIFHAQKRQISKLSIYSYWIP